MCAPTCISDMQLHWLSMQRVSSTKLRSYHAQAMCAAWILQISKLIKEHLHACLMSRWLAEMSQALQKYSPIAGAATCILSQLAKSHALAEQLEATQQPVWLTFIRALIM